jgi:hypothetical protein
MSGYLQRLASQATRPEANVRPLVNPFAGPARSTQIPELLEENLFQDTVAQHEDEPRQISTRPGATAEGQEDTRGPRPIPRNNPLKSELEAPFRPLLQESAIDLSANRNDPAAPHPADRERPIIASSVEHVVREQPQSRAADEDSKPGKTVTRKQVGPQPTRGGIVPRTVPDETRVSGTVAPLRLDQPGRVRASKASPPEADEILINIGRIEVTAVQQPVQRPAAPVRKAISLDEYLSRRNGRNG